MGRGSYRVVIARSARTDVAEKKKYILKHFKYREYADHFSKKMKKAIAEFQTIPQGYSATGFRYRGYDIYLKPCESYLIFYVIDDRKRSVTVLRVMQDGMDWQHIIEEWLKHRKKMDCQERPGVYREG